MGEGRPPATQRLESRRTPRKAGAVPRGPADTVALGDAYGILQARQTNDVVRQDFKFARTIVRDLAESGITSLLEHPEHEWPVIRADRNHGQASTHLRTGFLTFAIDELDAQFLRNPAAMAAGGDQEVPSVARRHRPQRQRDAPGCRNPDSTGSRAH
jgi:hypothetical protein